MSSEPKIESSIWEKIGDSLSAFSESVGKFITRLFGSSNERVIRGLGYVRASKAGAVHTVTPGSMLAQVNELEPKMQALDAEGLKNVTVQIREKLKQGATLDSVLPEAYAACREAAKRTKNMRHFDVQILGGAILHGYGQGRGNI